MTMKLLSLANSQMQKAKKCSHSQNIYLLKTSIVVRPAQFPSFKNSQIMHITVNQGVVLVFTIGSPKKSLQTIAEKFIELAIS